MLFPKILVKGDQFSKNKRVENLLACLKYIQPRSNCNSSTRNRPFVHDKQLQRICPDLHNIVLQQPQLVISSN